MDLLRNWNRRYDELPELWRFPGVLGLLVIVGAINLALTIGSKFPFGLLVLIAVVVLAAIRIPYLLSPHKSAQADWGAFQPPAPTPASGGWANRVNDWYESFPELWRFQLIVWTLVVLGALNMALTITGRFPFGLLVLLAIIVIAAIRLPRAMGWRRAAPARQRIAREPPSRALETSAPLPSPASPQNHSPVESVASPAGEESAMAHMPEDNVSTTHEEADPHPMPESAPPQIPPHDAALPPQVERPAPPPAA